jgi:hypothetical protein
MARVRITKKIPKALSGLEMKMSAGLYGKGTNGNSQFRSSGTLEAGKISQQPTEVRNTLQPVAREGANLEAEKGETAIVNIDGIPAHFKIGGKRHSEGGTPLNLPDNSFIFSDTAKMKITDPIMLAQFGMVPKKSGYTPAEIAKKYDINKYRQILADPNTDDIDRKTAEMMISNYNMKLAKLSLLQESKKGFPQGIPVVAMPYISEMEMNPEEFTSTQAQTDEPDADMGVSKYGGLHKAQEGLSLTKSIQAKAEAQKSALRKKREQDYLDEAAYLTEAGSPSYYTPSIDLTTSSKRPQVELPSDQSESMMTLRALYKDLQNEKNYGTLTNMFDVLPFVTSAEEKASDFKKIAKSYGYDSEKLQKQFETEKDQPILKYNPSTNQIETIDPTVKKPVTSVLQSKKEKPSAVKTSVESKFKDWTKPTEAELDSLSDEEANYVERLYKRYNLLGYAYGGSFEDGGAKGRLKSKLKGPSTTTTPNTTSTTKPTATTTTSPVNEYDPYAGLTEQELADLLSEETPIRKSKVSGKQKAGAEGTYGTDVSLEDFSKRVPEYLKAFETKYGRKFNPKTDAEIFQNEYSDHVEKLAYDRALKAGYGDTEAKSLAKKFKDSQGFQKEVKAGDPRGMDKKFGEFTSSRFEPIFKSIKKPVAVVPEPEVEREAFEQNTPIPYAENQNAPWWLQDIIKTAGAVGDKARIKKYLPWQATAPVALPDATFYDPTRELAANAEQANIANQAAAAFSDPRQLAAQQAATQGLAGRNAADIMGKYNTMNVGLANQVSQQNASIMNAANQNKANMDTQLWDKYTIANQQFDNSKAQARQQIRQSYIDAITNRANTANLNSMFPQYAVDPSSGGFTYFKNPKALDPTKNLNDINSQYAKALELTGDLDRALKLMQLQSTGKLPVDNTNYPNGYPG